MTTRIYTKTGDLGTTSLLGGTKVPKSHLRIETYGTIDELNSVVGLLGDHVPDLHSKKILNLIQDRLFTIGSSLASDPDKESKMKLPDLTEDDVLFLEHEIDTMNEILPPLTSFILPGGHPAVSVAHIARCVCRRAERHCVRMKEEELYIEPLIIKFLNRLSDHLFVLSRFTAHLLQVKEKEWKPRISTRPR